MTGQLDLLSPPVEPVHPAAVSRRARAGATVRAGSQKAALLSAYAMAGDRGLTDAEAAVAANLARPGVCYWKRCGELREASLIERTGATREAFTGESQTVCRITAAGVRATGLVAA